MEQHHYIPVTLICEQYAVEPAFIDELENYGLLLVERQKEERFISDEFLRVFERMMRLHYDLHINLEGIDAVLGLLNKLETLRDENQRLQNRLSRFEE